MKVLSFVLPILFFGELRFLSSTVFVSEQKKNATNVRVQIQFYYLAPPTKAFLGEILQKVVMIQEPSPTLI